MTIAKASITDDPKALTPEGSGADEDSAIREPLIQQVIQYVENRRVKFHNAVISRLGNVSIGNTDNYIAELKNISLDELQRIAKMTE